MIGFGQGHSDGSFTVGINYGPQGFPIGFNAGTATVGAKVPYLNQWHLYSLVYSDRVLTAYLDGEVLGTQNGSMTSSAGNAGMGIHWWSFAPGVSTRFIGSLADIRIYNRALSSQEIQTLSSAQSPPPAPTPTLAPDNGATPTANTTQPPAQEVNFDYFHDQLAPFGTWVQIAGYGWSWRPDAAINANPGWRPYYDMGQWVYTENGWFWQSDYTWGDIPFHYGNWILDPTYGWLWVPGYTWGPAWVFWRQAEADGCIGWAPLPPGAVFVNGGWLFHGVHYGVDFDFGLGEGYFAFIGYDHFHDDFFRMRGREYAFHVPRERIHEFYGRSVLRNDFRRDEHGRLINDGIGRDRIEQLTHHREEVMHFEERNPVGNREKLATQRIEEAPKRVAPQIGKPGEPGHEQFGKPVEQPAPVNKVFRPPTLLQNTPRTAPQRQTQVPQQKQPEKKQ